MNPEIDQTEPLKRQEIRAKYERPTLEKCDAWIFATGGLSWSTFTPQEDTEL